MCIGDSIIAVRVVYSLSSWSTLRYSWPTNNILSLPCKIKSSLKKCVKVILQYIKPCWKCLWEHLKWKWEQVLKYACMASRAMPIRLLSSSSSSSSSSLSSSSSSGPQSSTLLSLTGLGPLFQPNSSSFFALVHSFYSPALVWSHSPSWFYPSSLAACWVLHLQQDGKASADSWADTLCSMGPCVAPLRLFQTLPAYALPWACGVSHFQHWLSPPPETSSPGRDDLCSCCSWEHSMSQ